MFWKKKNKDKEDKTRPSFEASEGPRGSFRVEPDPDEPVIIFMEKTSVELVDISSGGLSIKNDRFEVNRVYSVHFKLPMGDAEINSKIKVLRINEEETCHCVFEEMTSFLEDQIHQYVLLRQKEDLRAGRKRRY